MRLWPLLFLAFVRLLPAGEEPSDPAFPLWDGQETVEHYAQRVKMPATESLDLGNGVKLELVLIPAGQFIMGTPEPEEVDEDGYRKQIVVGQALLAAGAGVLLVLLGAVVVQAIRRRRWPQYSLARFLAMTLAAGLAVLSGMHWWHSVQTLERAQAEFQAARARYEAAEKDEKPAHPVTLTKPFYMGKFVVTQEQYQQVTGKNPSEFKGQNNPVEQVSWDDAQEYCKRLSEQTGRTVRLPREAEWEYSCRAGTRTTYYSGDADKDLDRVAWYSANSAGATHPVGQKDPNVFGLYDMHGNVFQWCQDWYGEGYYASSPAEDSLGPAQGSRRVLRGGSWAAVPGTAGRLAATGSIPSAASSTSVFGWLWRVRRGLPNPLYFFLLPFAVASAASDRGMKPW